MSTTAIELFLGRYDKAVKGKSKDLRLQMNEAQQLAHEVTLLLGRSATLADKVIDLQEKLISERERRITTGGIQVEMDGGRFE